MNGLADARKPPKIEVVRPWDWQRITGALLLAFYALIAFILIRMVVVDFDSEFVARYLPRMFSGLWVTAKLVVISITLGAIIAFPMALARNSNNWLLRKFAFFYIYFFRGTPLLAQVFLVYYGAGQFRPFLVEWGLWGLFRDAYFCALLTFSLNTAAYQAEILRGAITAVPRGQWEAAQAFGLSKFATYWKVILPQALISALRPLGNEIIFMIKGSAVASIITVFDLMGETRLAYSRSFDFQVYLWAACMYLAIVEVLRRVWDVFEKRLTRHLERSPK
ncbi:MAG: ABC transporter permease [Hyphomicrobiales bacterium]